MHLLVKDEGGAKIGTVHSQRYKIASYSVLKLTYNGSMAGALPTSCFPPLVLPPSSSVGGRLGVGVGAREQELQDKKEKT